MPISRIIQALSALGLLAASLHAQDRRDPRFSIETTTEAYRACTLTSLGPDGVLQFADAGINRKASRLVELRQDGRELPPLPTHNFIILSNGDRLPLDPDAAARLQENRIHVWPAASLGGPPEGVNLFLPNVVLLFWSTPENVDEPEIFIARLLAERRKRDTVHLKNGDRVEGVVKELTARGGCVMALPDSKEVRISWSKLAGIAWNTDRQVAMRTKKTYVRATIEGGARVHLLELAFDEKSRQFTGKTQFGVTLRVDEKDLLNAEVRQGPATYLSDLKHASYESEPYLGLAWPLIKDRSVSLRSLSLAGGTYEKGLGAHAPCKITYHLDGAYQRFDALVGIHALAQKGRALAAIELDGKRMPLHGGKELTSQSLPIEVRIDVRKVKTLSLIVEPGSTGDVNAHVDWAKARLIKQE